MDPAANLEADLRALLWDIDGTLTKSGGAGSRALAATLHTRPRATAELKKMRLDGMTDRAIVRLLLAADAAQHDRETHASALSLEERARLVSEAHIDEVLAGYLIALEKECAANAYVAQAGVLELIPRLAARAELLLGLCTGNLERGAQLKLSAAGLWSAFRFGGYGSDAEPRPDIVRAAWRRARALGATEGLVIGDTPRDIQAAHEAGLPACGVATGRWTVHDLGVHGADLVVQSFADVDHAESLLLGPIPLPRE